MASFTININELTQLYMGVTVVDDCSDLSGINTKVYYSNTTSIEDGTILYSNESKTTFFTGNDLTYRGTSSTFEGTLDLTTVTITSYTFNINNSGVVSNIISC